jgi:hypothetical protein
MGSCVLLIFCIGSSDNLLLLIEVSYFFTLFFYSLSLCTTQKGASVKFAGTMLASQQRENFLWPAMSVHFLCAVPVLSTSARMATKLVLNARPATNVSKVNHASAET